MYICSNESLPILYKLEGSVQKCPDNYTVAVGKYRNAQNETGLFKFILNIKIRVRNLSVNREM